MVIADLVREHCRVSMVSDIKSMLAAHHLTMTPLVRLAVAKMTIGHLSELLRRLSEASTYNEVEKLFEPLEAGEVRGFQKIR